jgi:fatty-acyl-CoA synthase
VNDVNESIATLWEALADELGDVPAIVHGEQTRTWRAFDDRAARLAGHLEEKGVGVGDCVAIDLFNSVEYLEVAYAAMKVRAAPVNVSYRYRSAELAYVLRDSGAAAFFFDGSLADEVAPAVQDLDKLHALVRVGPPGSPVRAGETTFERALTSSPAARQTRNGDDTLILYTGGTTGQPKGTVWRHRDLLGNLAVNYLREGLAVPTTLAEARSAAGQVARAPRRRVGIPASPLMHGTGLMTSLGILTVGGQVVLLPSRSFDADELWRVVAAQRATDVTIVGDVFARPLVDALDRADAAGSPHDLSSLVRINSVGATWSAAAKQAILARADLEIVDVVMSSEGGPFAIAEARRGDDIGTSHFRLAPKARLLDDDGHDVEPGSGAVGVLAAPGPLPVGYLGDAEKTAATFPVIDGVRYAVPGDQAMLEADGTLVLLGRRSGVINTGGEKVFAEEVEDVVKTFPGVRDALVVGVPDERWGRKVVAVVAPEDGALVEETALAAHVGEVLARYKVPRATVVVDQIVRSPAGKADRRWAEQLAATTLGVRP